MIREEEARDFGAIQRVLDEAFEGDVESRLVTELRCRGLVVMGLVAEIDGEVVGHILFSRIRVDSRDAVALAPMAVKPALQRKGIGSALVLEGLTRCKQAGEKLVLVVGHPEFYARFGFSAKQAAKLDCEYAGDAFLSLELVPGSLAEGGKVVYSEPFRMFD